MRDEITLLASDIVGTSSSLLIEKSLAVSKRGLNSFPHDNEEDQRNIRKISRQRFAWEGRMLQLPHVPLQVVVDPLLSNELIYYLALGDYEQSDLEMIERMVRPGDKVMDVGGGAGICAARMAQCAQTPVVIVEARSDLKDLIFANLAANDLEGEFVQGALCDSVPDGTEVHFTMCENLWFSSLDGQTNGTKISTPSIRWFTLMERYTPDVVLIDIEGAETDLDFNTPHQPRAIAVEIHTPSIGSQKTCDVIQRIIDSGYRVVDVASQTWAFEKR